MADDYFESLTPVEPVVQQQPVQGQPVVSPAAKPNAPAAVTGRPAVPQEKKEPAKIRIPTSAEEMMAGIREKLGPDQAQLASFLEILIKPLFQLLGKFMGGGHGPERYAGQPATTHSAADVQTMQDYAKGIADAFGPIAGSEDPVKALTESLQAMAEKTFAFRSPEQLAQYKQDIANAVQKANTDGVLDVTDIRQVTQDITSAATAAHLHAKGPAAPAAPAPAAPAADPVMTGFAADIEKRAGHSFGGLDMEFSLKDLAERRFGFSSPEQKERFLHKIEEVTGKLGTGRLTPEQIEQVKTELVTAAQEEHLVGIQQATAQFEKDAGQFYAGLSDEKKALFTDLQGPKSPFPDRGENGERIMWGIGPDSAREHMNRYENDRGQWQADMKRFEESLSPAERQQWETLKQRSELTGDAHFTKPDDGVKAAPSADYVRIEDPFKRRYEVPDPERFKRLIEESPLIGEGGKPVLFNGTAPREWAAFSQKPGHEVSELSSQEHDIHDEARPERTATLTGLFGDRKDPASAQEVAKLTADQQMDMNQRLEEAARRARELQANGPAVA